MAGGIKATYNKKPKTEIAVVLDCSGSMAYVKTAAIGAFNKLTQKIKADVQQLDQDATVSLYTFSDAVTPVFQRVDLSNLRELKPEEYICDGWTALYDAMGQAISDLEKSPDHGLAHVSQLLLVITDGAENASKSVIGPALKNTIARVQATGDWTITVQLPPNTAKAFSHTLGIPLDNCREWETTTLGMEQSTVAATAGLGSYFTARGAGTKSVATFFVDTDLSKIDLNKLKKLTNLQTQFKGYAVPGETDIRSFIELKTGKPYSLGDSFYQLTKTEKIAQDKEVLLTEKNSTAVYGGPEVRAMIGLPVGGDAKVVPGNHANFDIFVQSKSTNRKIVRGTRVLVRK